MLNRAALHEKFLSGAGVAAAAHRASVLARVHAPFLVVLMAGLALRGYIMSVYHPVAAGFFDSITYLHTSRDHLFSDESRMAGYPLFLRIARYVVPDLTFVTFVQHTLGLATAALLYMTVRRVTGGRWLPAVPAGFAALSGDYLLLEHSLLTESLYMFLVTAAACALVFGVTAKGSGRTPRAYAVLALGGVLLASAWTIRSVALSLVVFAAVWLLAVAGPELGRRLRTAAAFAVPALGVICAYVILQAALTGFWGVLPGSGWITYMRVAPFADCREFDSPDETEFLCETSAPDTRSGPGYYQSFGGPGIARFGDPLNHDANGSEVVGSFARAAILGQPLTYLREAGRDALRHIAPSAGRDRTYAGPGPDELDIARRSPPIEVATVDAAAAVGFHRETFTVDTSLHSLADLQGVLRLSGGAILVLLALAALGVGIGRGPLRWASALLLGIAVLQPVTAAATISWGYRYGVVGMGQLVAAAMIGVAALAARDAQGRRATAQSERPNPTSTRSS